MLWTLQLYTQLFLMKWSWSWFWNWSRSIILKWSIGAKDQNRSKDLDIWCRCFKKRSFTTLFLRHRTDRPPAVDRSKDSQCESNGRRAQVAPRRSGRSIVARWPGKQPLSWTVFPAVERARFVRAERLSNHNDLCKAVIRKISLHSASARRRATTCMRYEAAKSRNILEWELGQQETRGQWPFRRSATWANDK